MHGFHSKYQTPSCPPELRLPTSEIDVRTSNASTLPIKTLVGDVRRLAGVELRFFNGTDRGRPIAVRHFGNLRRPLEADCELGPITDNRGR